MQDFVPHSSPTYADLELRILEKQAQGYPVELRLDGEQEFARGFLAPTIPTLDPDDDPQATGETLFRWLFADVRLSSAWAEVRGRRPNRRIRLRIDAEAPELHALPWETLRDPGDGVAAQDLAASTSTPFSRYLALPYPPPSPIAERPLKVLAAIAGPSDLGDYGLDPVDVDQEQASLAAAFVAQPVALTVLPQSCTLQAIEAALRDGCHVLHIVAHGVYDEKDGRAMLVLADERSRARFVPDVEVAEMLRRVLGDGAQAALRLVFLDSCETATRSPADAFRGLAPRLVAAGVPAVVAMQEPVAVVTGRAFAATFYRRLLDHELVDMAANEARSHLLSAGLPGASIPVLFMRLKDGRLLACEENAGDEDHAEPLFTVPFLRNEKSFVDREEDLQAVHDRLWENGEARFFGRLLGLTGLGGIGKTQLAVEYCYRHRAACPGGIFWIDAAESLVAGFAVQGVALKPDLADGTQNEQVHALANHLRHHDNALLVLDNLGDPTSLTIPVLPGVLPADFPCKILFTTRQRDVAPFAAFEVSELPEDAALELLLRADNRRPVLQSSHPERAEAKAICRTLGNLPLALELAAAFLGKQPRVTLADYLRDLGLRSRLEVLDDVRARLRDTDLPTRHRAAVATTFAEQVLMLSNADSSLLLRVAGQLPEPAQVPVSWLATLSGLSDQDDGIFGSPLRSALEELDEKSLVRNLDAGAINLHPLVHEFAGLLTPQDQRTSFREELADHAVGSLSYADRRDDWPITVGQCLLAFGWAELPQEKRIVVLNAVRSVMVGSKNEVVARRAAFVLTGLDWLGTLPGVNVADILLYLDQIGRYVASYAECQYLSDRITYFLASEDLDPLQRTQLLVRRGAMFGQVNNLEAAERDYGEAARLVQNLLVDTQVAALIYLGGGNIARRRAEDQEVSEGERQQSKEEAEHLYGLLAQMLGSGQTNLELEPEVRISCHLQLLRWFVFQKSWQEAEEHDLMARQALEDVFDPETRETNSGWIAESHSEMYWHKGNWHDSRREPTEALDAYEEAYETACKAVDRLRVVGAEESVNLAYALCNSGKYLLALSGFPGCSVGDARSRACENWREALEIAVRLNLEDVEVEARTNIGNHCI